MAEQKQAYFGIESLGLNLVLWFFFSPLLGIIQAFINGNILWGVLRFLSFVILIGFVIFPLVDLISFIMHKNLKFLI